jgi:hypothetical protein
MMNISWKKNLNHLIVRDFWMIKIWPYFHKSIWATILFYFFNFFVLKTYFKKITHGIIRMDFVSFPFRTSKF